MFIDISEIYPAADSGVYGTYTKYLHVVHEYDTKSKYMYSRYKFWVLNN